MANTRESRRRQQGQELRAFRPSSSESDGGTSRGWAEVCGICLSRVAERGYLDCCNHLFCFKCIKRWSELESRCPTCRKRFVTIILRSVMSGQRVSEHFSIPNRNQGQSTSTQSTDSSSEEEVTSRYQSVSRSISTPTRNEGQSTLRRNTNSRMSGGQSESRRSSIPTGNQGQSTSRGSTNSSLEEEVTSRYRNVSRSISTPTRNQGQSTPRRNTNASAEQRMTDDQTVSRSISTPTSNQGRSTSRGSTNLSTEGRMSGDQSASRSSNPTGNQGQSTPRPSTNSSTNRRSGQSVSRSSSNPTPNQGQSTSRRSTNSSSDGGMTYDQSASRSISIPNGNQGQSTSRSTNSSTTAIVRTTSPDFYSREPSTASIIRELDPAGTIEEGPTLTIRLNGLTVRHGLNGNRGSETVRVDANGYRVEISRYRSGEGSSITHVTWTSSCNLNQAPEVQVDTEHNQVESSRPPSTRRGTGEPYSPSVVSRLRDFFGDFFQGLKIFREQVCNRWRVVRSSAD